MRILLTNAPKQFYHLQRFILKSMPELNLPLLAAMVRDEHDVRILDNALVRFREDAILPTARSYRPDVVAISNNVTSDNTVIRKVISKIKRELPEMVVIVGGQFPTGNPTLILEAGADYVVRHEGEHTFRELIAWLATPGDPDRVGRETIQGICFLENGRLVSTPDRPFMEDLDESPIPARDLMQEYPTLLRTTGRSTAIETSRGCLNACSFCEIGKYWKRTRRRKSAKRLLGELDLMHQQGFTEFYFVDDSVGFDEVMDEVFREMIARRYDFHFGVQITARCVVNNPDYIQLMVDAGLRLAGVGFESYRKSELEGGTKGARFELNRDASEALRRHGVVVMGTHVFGLPEQTEKDLDDIARYGPRFSDLFRSGLYVPLASSVKSQLAEGRERYQFNGILSRREVVAKYYAMQMRHWFGPQGIGRTIFDENPLVRRMMRRAYISNVLAVLSLSKQRFSNNVWCYFVR